MIVSLYMKIIIFANCIEYLGRERKIGECKEIGFRM